MGNTASTIPGRLNIVAKAGEAVSQLLDFSISLTGYEFEGEIVSAITFQTIAALDVTAVNLAAGQVNVGLSVADAADVPAGTYLWRMAWTPPGGSERTAIEGIWEATR